MSKSLYRLKKICSLLKPLIRPRLSILNAVSAVGGYCICSDVINLPTVLGLSAGITFSAFSASALNQVMESDRDAIMDRTKSRPLPMKTISSTKAVGVGLLTGALGLYTLNATCNPLSAMISAGTIISYLAIYTPLKTRTIFNTEIGAVIGALPPLIGCAAAGSSIFSQNGLYMFLILYFWQMHHFRCVSWLHRDDYAKAGYKMNLTDAPKSGFIHSMAMVALAVAGVSVVSPLFGVVSAGLSCFVTRAFYKFMVEPNLPNGRKTLAIGLIQLLVVMISLILVCANKTRGSEKKEQL